MPSVSIDYSKAADALKLLSDASGSPFVVSTPFGLSILEIQGQLLLPPSVPQTELAVDPEQRKTFVKVDDIRDAVHFGNLSFDENDPNKVILFIGTSQRLIGAIETLPQPLGVLRMTTGNDNADLAKARIVDIIYKKLIFKHRPLPIM